MQAAKTLHALSARTQHQVICIAEDDIRPGILHLIHVQRLHGAGGADGHKSGRANVSARRLQNAGAGLAFGGFDLKRECCHGPGLYGLPRHLPSLQPQSR